MRVEVMLYVYLFVCAAMIAFNIVAAVIFRMDGRRTERIGRGLYRRVSEQLGRGGAVDRHHIRYLCRKLRRTGNMIAFDKMLESVYAERPREARDYLRSIDEVFVSLMILYARRDRIEAAYFPYIIRKYRVIAIGGFRASKAPCSICSRSAAFTAAKTHCRRFIRQAMSNAL